MHSPSPASKHQADAPREPTQAPLLKDGFSASTVRSLAERLATVHPGLDSDAFLASCLKGFEALSLMERVRRVAHGLQLALPADFKQALPLVEASMGVAPAALLEGEGIAAFRSAPMLEWVALAGLGEPDLALPALARLTRHFSAEFAIRPFLEAHLDLTLAAASDWTRDPDPRVRRLASEGTRPWLPWGRQVKALKAAPERALALLLPLASDPVDFVRRSAANHLNDVSRIDAALAVQHAVLWAGQGEGARHTVRHALRNRIKAGDPAALQLLGFDTEAEFAIERFALSAVEVPVGGDLWIEGELRSQADAPVRASVDVAVRYASAKGSERWKVFKGTEATVSSGAPLALRFRRDFIPRTTRALYPGTHWVQLRVNGRTLAEASFELVARS